MIYIIGTVISRTHLSVKQEKGWIYGNQSG
ncbi:MAG: hypothetical protein FD166_3317 [Bacteroidetes bacterium]|nr:MAG: hypothetical protein FD166_3317 [Bacteroidota bacterium]